MEQLACTPVGKITEVGNAPIKYTSFLKVKLFMESPLFPGAVDQHTNSLGEIGQRSLSHTPQVLLKHQQPAPQGYVP